MTPLTPHDIREVERLMERVTKGPWMVHQYNDHKGIDVTAIYQTPEAAKLNGDSWTHPHIADDVIRQNDAAFIAASRTLVPQLISALKASRESLETTAHECKWKEMYLYAFKDRESVKAKLDALSEALKDYGRHTEECTDALSFENDKCTCGFTQALEGETK